MATYEVGPELHYTDGVKDGYEEAAREIKRLRAWAADEQRGRHKAEDQRTEARSEAARLRATLVDLECAFANTSEIPETPFTLHALDAIRRALGCEQRLDGNDRAKG